MKSIRKLGFLAVTGFLGTCGCATSMAPQDLVTARSAYDQASRGPAARLDPADMHAAKEQLDVAEASFQENGDTQHTRDEISGFVRERMTSYKQPREIRFVQAIPRNPSGKILRRELRAGL